MKKVLIVLSGADKWTRKDGSIYESGVWAEEFIVMDELIREAGFDVDIATPAALLAAKDNQGNWPFIGRKMTATTVAFERFYTVL